MEYCKKKPGNVVIQQTAKVIDILIVEETKEGLISARVNYTYYEL